VAQRSEIDERNRRYEAEMASQRQRNGGLTDEQLDKMGMEKGLAWLQSLRGANSAPKSVEVNPVK